MLAAEDRVATPAEQTVLARWSSWGAVPDVFDEAKANWASERAELRTLLNEREYAEARRTTINAHYTDPAYVREIWAALGELGFDGGRVLEPGSGAGTFIGLAPEGAEMTGVELDSMTATISAGLYPRAHIIAESFADTRFPAEHFDAAVGNVPFADVVLYDPLYNGGQHSIHNHFILKSLAMTRPGGLVAVLSSRYTLDSQNPAARREMNQLADLVGAVRLPAGAHRRAAGTDVVTDVLVFRRREPGEPPRDLQWETLSARSVDGEIVKLNSYFDSRPENILGELSLTSTQYGSDTLTVKTDDVATVPQRLREALAGIVVDARERGQLMTARSERSHERLSTLHLADRNVWDGTIQPDGKDAFTIVVSGQHEPLKVPKSAAVELRALLSLRDGAAALLKQEAAALSDSAELTAARLELRIEWERYVNKYGPLNRFDRRPTGRVDAETGESTFARITPTAPRILRQDPHGPLVFALERFDEESQTARPASVLERRVIAPRPLKAGAETPAEALALSVDRTGEPDLDTIAHLLGVQPDEARTMLGELVYDDPATGELVTSAEYLSGNVREKLDRAREAAAADPERYAANAAALEAVVPPTITADQIQARMGAVWISAEVHRDFLREILNDRTVEVENPLPATWDVKGNRRTLRATSEWGTERRPAIDLAKSLMEQSVIKVMDKITDGDKERQVLNPTETTAAQEKADALQERFGEWVWEEPARAQALVTEYNRRFNSIVLRDYSTEGEYLTLPGLAANFTPRPHQRAAVARMIAEPAVGLFHQVGAGKTAEMVIGTMELRRMGLVQKPVVVVPNHMLEQFGREWLQLYPQARILAASSDELAGDRRRMFIARAAANDWDAIIMTRTAYQRLPLAPETQATFINGELDELRRSRETTDAGKRNTVKAIEKAIASAEEKLKRLIDQPRDPGITFEATGIDYVVVDEMHDYKNLATVSNIPDANIQGSARATDMLMKLEYLRSRHGKRVTTVATATPLANSVTEAHVMQRYLRPDLLRAAGVLNFDAWAATFGKTVTEMEMGIAGGGSFKMKTRFASFQNVPEMLRMWHVFADVKTAEDLNLPTPALRRRADGERLPETIVMPPSPELQQYLEVIAERADRVSNRAVTPDEDNMLWIASDGRMAALDMRMVDPNATPSFSKLDRVAANIAAIWEEHRDQEYLDPETGEASEVRGALQIVFSDLGTPSKDRWNAYDELKMKLVQAGVPEAGIRYIHEAKSDADKARLFAAARAGHVSVLIGSTGKMGVGTNVQARAIALHHVDCPWRPADVEQRDGRGMRQGNQNQEFGIYRYVVEGSFDAYMWETVARKAKFIAQIMRGKLDVREIDDIGDVALSAAETKALASGNPLLLEHSVASNELAKLERLERAWHRNQINLASSKQSALARIDGLAADVAQLERMAPLAVDTSEDKFRMTVAGRTFDKRADAAVAIASWANTKGVRYLPVYGDRQLGELGMLGGYTVDVQARTVGNVLTIEASLRDVPGARIMVPRDQFMQGGVGYVRSLENRTSAIPTLIGEAQTRIAEAETIVADADRSIGQTFKRADELTAARERVERVTAALEAAAEPERTASAGETVERAPEQIPDAAAIARLGFAKPARDAVRRAAPNATSARPADAGPDVPALDR